MPKVGIMTWFQYHNYGSALQVTAMQEILKKAGCSPVVIQYYTKPYFFECASESLVKYIMRKCIRRLKKSIGKSQYSSMEREKEFDEFISNHLLFTDRCDTLSELEALNDKFDYFICGSDQIWAPSGFDPHYFFDFVSDDKKKIAYAPSLGLTSIKNDKVKKEMAKLCSLFAHLSTREESGSKIIHDITGREVKTVLDPTLLLNKDEWRKFESKDISVPDAPYLLVYMLGQNKRHWQAIRRIAKKLKLKIIIIPVFRRDFYAMGCIKSPIGPAEFLSLISSAAFVCTDSFHGMAFSINYGKQFAVFERFMENDPLNQNSRIYNLADKLGLNNRIITESNGIENMLNNIDYIDVRLKLDALIAESLRYLKGSLAINDMAKN